MKLLLISGFLGSGKTTLLLEIARRLAADDRKIAIIENEVGEVGIDRIRRSVKELNEKTRVVAISAEQRINLEDLMGALQ